MQQNGNKYFARRHPPLTLGVGSKGQNSTFSEYGHVAYQIKGSDGYSSMVTILLADPPPPPWGRGQKVMLQLFQNMVMLNIKLKRTTHAATC